MTERIKIKPTMFLVYDYDKEEEYMNSMSEKGWQLKKGGLFHHTYIQDNQLYRYKLDYNNGVHINSGENSRYLAIFAEQGWEHINSTFNGWHYFRKKYDSALPEDDYEIYTDDNSLKEMLSKWNRLARILQFVLVLSFFSQLLLYYNYRTRISLYECIMLTVAFGLVELCAHQIKKKRVGTKPSSDISKYGGYVMTFGLFLMIILILLSIFLPSYVYKLDYTTDINQDTPDFTDTLNIKQTGYYQLNFRCKSERGVSAFLISKGDTVVYDSGAGGDFFLNKPDCYFETGNYTVRIVYYLEDYEKSFDATERELESLHLTGDLDQMSEVEVSVSIRNSF